VKKVIALFLVFLVLNSCKIVPVSNRLQLNIYNEQKLIRVSSTEYQSLVKSKAVSTKYVVDDKLIKEVGQKISNAVENYLRQNNKDKRLKGFKWEFNLVESEEINAFCLPGGKVLFNTGILPICQDETGIAVVMGHEIAHAIARHGNERISKRLTLSIVLLPVLIFGGSALYYLTRIGGDLASLSHSRKHESEADKMGLVFMALAGYNPDAAIGFWERMAAVSKGKQSALLSTHPPDEKRIKRLKKYLPKAQQYYKN